MPVLNRVRVFGLFRFYIRFLLVRDCQPIKLARADSLCLFFRNISPLSVEDLLKQADSLYFVDQRKKWTIYLHSAWFTFLPSAGKYMFNVATDSRKPSEWNTLVAIVILNFYLPKGYLCFRFWYFSYYIELSFEEQMLREHTVISDI